MLWKGRSGIGLVWWLDCLFVVFRWLRCSCWWCCLWWWCCCLWWCCCCWLCLLLCWLLVWLCWLLWLWWFVVWLFLDCCWLFFEVRCFWDCVVGLGDRCLLIFYVYEFVKLGVVWLRDWLIVIWFVVCCEDWWLVLFGRWDCVMFLWWFVILGCGGLLGLWEFWVLGWLWFIFFLLGFYVCMNILLIGIVYGLFGGGGLMVFVISSRLFVNLWNLWKGIGLLMVVRYSRCLLKFVMICVLISCVRVVLIVVLLVLRLLLWIVLVMVLGFCVVLFVW